MKKEWLSLGLLLVVLALVSCEEPTEQERNIEKRDAASNGILVGSPKVYDDSLLQQMLNTAEARLVSLQVLDQTGIASGFGAITGANQQISSFAIAAQGPTPPQSVLTSNGATNQVASTLGGSSGNSTVTTTTAPVQNVTTTSPQLTAPTATPPAASTRSEEFEDPPFEFFREQLLKLPESYGYARQFLWDNWSDLRKAIEECWRSKQPPASIPFVLTSLFMRHATQQKNPVERILAARNKLGA